MIAIRKQTCWGGLLRAIDPLTLQRYSASFPRRRLQEEFRFHVPKNLRGKHVLYICTNLSCKLLGADALLAHAMQAAGVGGPDEVSGDGLFTVQEVECLGACEYAPMMRLDHRYYYDLTPEKVDALVAERRSSSPLTPTLSPEGKRESRRSSSVAPAARPHPAASPPTSPASGEVKRKKKKADG